MRHSQTLALAAATMAFAAPAWADFPEKPVNLVVGFRSGGGSDTAARILATEMEATLGQKIIVENRGGAGGAVATEYVRAQDPDGYTIGFAVATTFSFTPLTGSVAYTPDDVTFIATTHGYRTVMAAPADAPFDDWAGMLETAKERGWINYASIIPLDRAIMQYVGKKEDIAINIVPTRGGSGARPGRAWRSCGLGVLGLERAADDGRRRFEGRRGPEPGRDRGTSRHSDARRAWLWRQRR